MLNVIGTAQITDPEKEGVRGFTQTIQAYAYMMVLFAHTEDSIPIDVNRPLSDPPAPFVTNVAAWDHVVSLLDSAQDPPAGGGRRVLVHTAARVHWLQHAGRLPEGEPRAAGASGLVSRQRVRVRRLL